MRLVLFLVAIVFATFQGWYFLKTAPQAVEVEEKARSFHFEYEDSEASSIALGLLFQKFPLSEEAASARRWLVSSQQSAGEAGGIEAPEEPFFQEVAPFVGLPGVLAVTALLFLLGLRRAPVCARILGLLGFGGVSGLIALQYLWHQMPDHHSFEAEVYAHGAFPGALVGYSLATLLLLVPRSRAEVPSAVEEPPDA